MLLNFNKACCLILISIWQIGDTTLSKWKVLHMFISFMFQGGKKLRSGSLSIFYCQINGLILAPRRRGQGEKKDFLSIGNFSHLIHTEVQTERERRREGAADSGLSPSSIPVFWAVWSGSADVNEVSHSNRDQSAAWECCGGDVRLWCMTVC